jgi:hypothetical protein
VAARETTLVACVTVTQPAVTFLSSNATVRFKRARQPGLGQPRKSATMKKSILVLATIALGVMACGTDDASISTTSTPTDAGGPESGPPELLMWAAVSTDNTACFPRRLPVASDGTVTCHLLVVLAAGGSCDAAKGLAAADPALRAGLSLQIDISANIVCEATQLSPASLVDGSCVASTLPGWCAVSSSDAGQCPQAIRRSAQFDVTPDTRLAIACEPGTFP